jgi:endoglucanase
MMSALVCLLALTVSVGPPQSPVEEHGRLKAQGNRIVGEHGRPVSLAGNSLFWSQWMPQFYNADVVRWLKQDFRAQIVRAAVGVYSDGYLQDPERETARADAVIDAAIAEGLYVIIDWHDHHADQNERLATEFFQRMARKYGRHPNVIYEIFNEPMKVSWREVVKPYSERVIAAIRAIDPDNLILVGSPTWSQDVDVAAADPVQDANVAYTLHFYAGTHRQGLRDKAERALGMGVALFVSEWGTCDANGDGAVDTESTQEWLEFMRKHQLSHLNWSIADKVEAASVLRPGASARGGWSDADLTESGRFVRGIVRSWSP